MSVFAEVGQVHTRLLRCTLEVDNSRAYWERADGAHLPVSPHLAFSEYWFGAKSFPRVQLFLAEFRHRFDAYPSALQVLHAWKGMSAETRNVLCHWHRQLCDPLYRRLTGEFLVSRREEQRIEVTRDSVARWVEQQSPRPLEPADLREVRDQVAVGGVLGWATDWKPGSETTA